MRALAKAFCDGNIRFDNSMSAEEFSGSLQEIAGIGEWTTQYIAMRALGDPDAFPCGDLSLLHALGLTSKAELQRRAEAWRPWRAYATIYLWNGAATGGSSA